MSARRTVDQDAALRWFRANDVGSMRFEGRWLWPADLRADAELAERFWKWARGEGDRAAGDILSCRSAGAEI